MGEGNKKLSKRDPQSNLFHHRDRGFIPEGLLNYLALLGWGGYSSDTDVFSLDEMIAAFDVRQVNSNPARFDQKKADAINAEHIRRLETDDFTARLKEFLIGHGHLSEPVDDVRFAALAELVQTRIQVLADAGTSSSSSTCPTTSSRSTRRPRARTWEPTQWPFSTPPSPPSSR